MNCIFRGTCAPHRHAQLSHLPAGHAGRQEDRWHECLRARSEPQRWPRWASPVDVFTRSQDDCAPRVDHDLGPNARVMHIPAGPERPLAVNDTVALHRRICRQHPGLCRPRRADTTTSSTATTGSRGWRARQLRAGLAGHTHRPHVPHAGPHEEPDCARRQRTCAAEPARRRGARRADRRPADGRHAG